MLGTKLFILTIKILSNVFLTKWKEYSSETEKCNDNSTRDSKFVKIYKLYKRIIRVKYSP